MKIKNKFHSTPVQSKQFAELINQKKTQAAEKEENRKRVMSTQLFNIIGNKKIVISSNSH